MAESKSHKSAPSAMPKERKVNPKSMPTIKPN